jgi:hypothetical protein
MQHELLRLSHALQGTRIDVFIAELRVKKTRDSPIACALWRMELALLKLRQRQQLAAWWDMKLLIGKMS